MSEILIERRESLIRIAVKENGKMTECLIEEDNQEAKAGEIYKGIVKNIVPGIKCAFVDIGLKKNAYLYMDNKFGNMNIKKGQELIVEILKEAVGDKGAKVTNAVSIPGRYVALVTSNNNISVSNKISDDGFKNEVKSKVFKPEDIGIMIRTNSEGKSIDVINKEIQEIYAIYKQILLEASYAIKPKLLYGDKGAVERVLRDNVDDRIKKIIVDNEEDYDYIKQYISDNFDKNISVELYSNRRTLFDYYEVEREILNLRNKRVNLSCGGYIIIDKTEAMYVIDVNSGKNITERSMDKTALMTNIEAAEVISQQVRLRNLSGIILVDFIDVSNKADKYKIISALEKGFNTDKNKSKIFPFTELNLVQIARKRKGKSISEYMEEECEKCGGKGKKIKREYMLLLIKNELLRVDEEDKIKDFYIEINEDFKKDIEDDILSFIKGIDGLNKSIYLNFTATVDTFKLDPLIFMNQIQNVEKFKVYGENFFTN